MEVHRTDRYTELSNSDHLLITIEAMRKLLSEKDSEIKTLRALIKQLTLSKNVRLLAQRFSDANP